MLDKNDARAALADAAAGVAGSLASMIAFYPMDVYKTKLQAGILVESSSSLSLSSSSSSSSSSSLLSPPLPLSSSGEDDEDEDEDEDESDDDSEDEHDEDMGYDLDSCSTALSLLGSDKGTHRKDENDFSDDEDVGDDDDEEEYHYHRAEELDDKHEVAETDNNDHVPAPPDELRDPDRATAWSRRPRSPPRSSPDHGSCDWKRSSSSSSSSSPRWRRRRNTTTATTMTKTTKGTIPTRESMAIRRAHFLSYLSDLFRGLHLKAAHTVASSFAYFFLHSFVQGKHRRHHRMLADAASSSSSALTKSQEHEYEYNPSAATRLALSAVAAAANTCLTLPLDVLSARSQTRHAWTAEDDLCGNHHDQRQDLDHKRNSHYKNKRSGGARRGGRDGDGDGAADGEPTDDNNDATFGGDGNDSDDNNRKVEKKHKRDMWDQIKTTNTYHAVTSQQGATLALNATKIDVAFTDMDNTKTRNAINGLRNHGKKEEGMDAKYRTVGNDDGSDVRRGRGGGGATLKKARGSISSSSEAYHTADEEEAKGEKEKNNVEPCRRRQQRQQQQQQNDTKSAQAICAQSESLGTTSQTRILITTKKKTNTQKKRGGKTNNYTNKQLEHTVTRPITHSYSTIMMSQIAQCRLKKQAGNGNGNGKNKHGRDQCMNNDGTMTTTRSMRMSAITSLWSGLWPSLLLCSNPSIHFTVFDAIKSSMLRRRRMRLHTPVPSEMAKSTTRQDRLTILEAFLIGLVAKSVATLATYPLIRAKVMLMCGANRSSSSANGGHIRANGDDDDDNDNDNDNDGKRTTRQPHPPPPVTMTRLLWHMYKQDGICRGWYRGCILQLMHTVLKSALLMAVRERITAATRRLICG